MQQVRNHRAVHAVQRGVTAADEPLMGPEQVSELLGNVPTETLRDWRKKGTGPDWTRVGRRIRYYPASVREFRDRGRVTAAP